MGTKEMGGLLALCFFLGCVAPLCAYAQCGYTPPTARDVSVAVQLKFRGRGSKLVMW